MISDDYSHRDENILVLPHNTIRIVDAPIDAMIKKYKNPKWDEPIENTIYRVLHRKGVNLALFNNLNEEESKIVYDSLNNDWASFFEIAPKSSIVYDLLNIFSKQKFIKDIVILFSDKRAWDPSHRNDYYDGTLTGLENFIIKNNITTIFMDNIEILYQIYKRGNVKLDDKSIFLSKIGYNYEFNEELGKIMLKHILEIINNTECEIGEINLTNFEKETINHFKDVNGGN